MLLKVLIVAFVLLRFACCNDCSRYFQYIKDDNGEMLGLAEIPSKLVPEHRFRVQITVKGQLTNTVCIT